MKSIYPWQQNNWRSIESLLAGQRLPHALLLAGSPDSGKYRFADVLAETLLCEQRDSGVACGFCKQCQLLIAGNHPDRMVLEPEGKGQVIPIDRIREVIEFAAKTAQQGGWKVVIVNRAEKMNTYSANALLKVLEEPPENTLITLVSGDISQVMPTVKSRCRQVLFPAPLAAEVLPWLSEVVSSNTAAKEALEAAYGRPLLALRLLQDDLLEKRRQLESAWLEVAEGRLSPVSCAEQCSKLDAVSVMDWFYYFLTMQLKALSSQAKQRYYFKMLDALSEARALLESGTNPNEQLMWEELMLDWRAVANTGGA